MGSDLLKEDSLHTMALSTDYALRTGAFEPAEASVNAQDLRGSCE